MVSLLIVKIGHFCSVKKLAFSLCFGNRDTVSLVRLGNDPLVSISHSQAYMKEKYSDLYGIKAKQHASLLPQEAPTLDSFEYMGLIQGIKLQFERQT